MPATTTQEKKKQTKNNVQLSFQKTKEIWEMKARAVKFKVMLWQLGLGSEKWCQA